MNDGMTFTAAELHLLLVEMDDEPECPDCDSETVVQIRERAGLILVAHDADCPAMRARRP